MPIVSTPNYSLPAPDDTEKVRKGAERMRALAAASDTAIHGVDTATGDVKKGLSDAETRLAALDGRLATFESRLAVVDSSLAAASSGLATTNGGLATVNSRLTALGSVQTELQRRARHYRANFDNVTIAGGGNTTRKTPLPSAYRAGDTVVGMTTSSLTNWNIILAQAGIEGNQLFVALRNFSSSSRTVNIHFTYMLAPLGN